MEVLLRGKLADEQRNMVDIVGYDLELGKFDCHDNTTRTPEDFIYFVIPSEEMKNINKYIAGLVEAKPKATRKKTKTTLEGV